MNPLLDLWENHGKPMGKLTCAKRGEWMGMGVAGMIITSDYGSFPHLLLSTSKKIIGRFFLRCFWSYVRVVCC